MSRILSQSPVLATVEFGGRCALLTTDQKPHFIDERLGIVCDSRIIEERNSCFRKTESSSQRSKLGSSEGRSTECEVGAWWDKVCLVRTAVCSDSLLNGGQLDQRLIMADQD